MLADVHVHLDKEPEASLARAEEAGVGIILAAGKDLATSQANVSLAARHKSVKACVGIHPWVADLFSSEAEEALRKLIQTGRVSAISETGIDLVRRKSEGFSTDLPPLPLAFQVQAFQAQLRLASATGLAVVFHDRGGTREILDILDEFANEIPRGIVHGFNGTIEEARQYRQRGFLISVNIKCLPMISPVLEILHMDEIVLETDSKEPAQVVNVCREVALLKKVTEKEVAAATTSNLQKLLEEW